MSRISIVDLELYCHLGVTEKERATAQRILVTVDLNFDFSSAALSDRIEKTINYHSVAERLLKFSEGRSWKLIEKLAANIADIILGEFKPQEAAVEIKKFSIPQARYVSVSLTRSRAR